MYYRVSISETFTSSAVSVSKLQDLEQAISFGFQLHQISTYKHYITVKDSDGILVASFVRLETYSAPLPGNKPAPVPDDSKKSVFSLKKKS